MSEPRIVTSLDEVADCLPMDRAIDLVDHALRDPRTARIAPATLELGDGTAFRIVAGATGGSAVVRFGAAGRFWATGRAHLLHWAAVLDPETGDLRALLRFPFADLRVAATLGAAARGLADGPATVAMIGAGNYAFRVLEAVHAAVGIRSLAVASRTQAHAQALAERVGTALAVPAVTAPDPREAVRDARVIVVGTDSLEPVVDAGWLGGDQLVLSYGQPTELDRSVFLAADRLCAADPALELASSIVSRHPLAGPDGTALRPIERLGGLLEAGADGLVVVRDGGGGVGDAALAAGLAVEVERRGLGTAVGA